jgi:hypothetical protein
MTMHIEIYITNYIGMKRCTCRRRGTPSEAWAEASETGGHISFAEES